MANLEEAKLVLAKLALAGMKKLNFAGGEPLLTPKYREFVGEIAIYCKQDLGLESISIVSNGSKISRAFLEKYHSWIDILAISVDSFNEETNKKIGRGRIFPWVNVKDSSKYNCNLKSTIFKSLIVFKKALILTLLNLFHSLLMLHFSDNI
jgi:molybdenum cofactor biosynthesis enzyme MoaA